MLIIVDSFFISSNLQENLFFVPLHFLSSPLLSLSFFCSVHVKKKKSVKRLKAAESDWFVQF